jgi:hypothetical protein
MIQRMSRVVSLLISGFLILGAVPAHAALYAQHSFTYQSNGTDGQDSDFNYSTMRNHFFLGAVFGKKENFIIGNNIGFFSRNAKSTGGLANQEQDLSVLEIGPRLLVYTSEEKNFYLGFAYHPFARGNLKISGSPAEDVSGSSFLVNLGTHLNLGQNLFIGFALNYQHLMVSQKIINNVKSTSSYRDSSFFPSFEVSYRF